jgi:hypothetical protein
MTTDALPADRLVAIYRRIRGVIDEKENAHKEEIARLKSDLDVVSEQILAICNEQNLDSLRTPEGTVTRRMKSRYWTTDWDNLYQFIKENDAPYLLQQRIHEGNMKQFLDENSNVHPIGLQVDNTYVITVRKPTNR